MSWTDPAAAVALFETGDVFGASSFNSYVLQNLLSMPHPLEAPTTALLDINTTVAETTLYSVTVPGNALGVNGSVEMMTWGSYLHNNVGADALTVRVKFGGVTQFADTTDFSGVVGASRQPWLLNVIVANLGATNSQSILVQSSTHQANVAAPTTGTGKVFYFSGTDAGVGGISTLGTVDTTANQTLVITVQWAASSANNSFARRWARTLIGQN